MKLIHATFLTTLLIGCFILHACSSPSQSMPEEIQQTFIDNLESLCGQAFAGQLVTDDPEDEAWRDADIKMHMFDCADGAFKIALHVGEHRSMTWIVSREAGVLSLLHDHRQKDGSPHAFTGFGGTAKVVTDRRAEFPANPESIDIFDRIGLPDSAGRKWALEVQSDSGVFAYERARPDHFFRLEFDTNTPIQTPSMPWGW